MRFADRNSKGFKGDYGTGVTIRLNDRGRLDLGVERKVDVGSMRYQGRKRKRRTAVHSGYVRTREEGQHNDKGKEKKRADPWACQGAGGGAVNVRGFQPGGAWVGVGPRQKERETRERR